MRILVFFMVAFSIASAQALVFGIVPQQSPSVLFKKWNKVIAYLSEETGYDITFKTELSIPKFEQELNRGKYDLAYMNPYHFMVAKKRQNYAAYIRADNNIRGILVSKNKDLKLSSTVLQNQTFLYPAPNSFAATLLTKMELLQKFGFDVQKDAHIHYVNSHDSVYKGIARDIGFIGGGIERTYNNFAHSDDKNLLHIIYKTDAYPSHPIAFHPKVKQEVIQKIQAAFLKMPKEIKRSLSIKNFIKTNSQEFDIIKNLDI